MDDRVGPVLEASEVGRAIVTAIRDGHPDVEVVDRAAYLRVLVPKRCRVTREAIEMCLGRPFALPSDLEMVMPSFKGKMRIGHDDVVWEVG
jgi:toluene monooxygenase system protein D